MKRELGSVVEKPKTQDQGSDAVEHVRLAREAWQQTQGYQTPKWQERLQSRKTGAGVAARQHEIARAIVVVTVHPGDCHEVRKLPEENHQEERPSFKGQLIARCGPADQGRHGAWNGPDQRT